MDSTRLGGVLLAVAAAAGLIASATVVYCFCRKQSTGRVRTDESETGLQLPNEDMKDNDALDRMETPPTKSVPPDAQIKKQPLSGEDMRARALFLFPGLLQGDYQVHQCDPRDLEELVESKIRWRRKALEKEVGENEMERLIKLENAVELCVELGLNEDVVRRRYQVVNNLKKELDLPSKTPTMVTIRHLVKRISSIDNSFGNEEDMDGVIREEYKDRKWLSYMGVPLRRGRSLQQSLQVVTSELERCKYDKCFMHGTSGDKLIKIFEDDGEMAPSNGLRGGHDFGSGVYCFRGELYWALSFAIDRSWMFNEKVPTNLQRHNPAIVAFPAPIQLNARDKKHSWMDVGKKKPYKNHRLASIIREEHERDTFIAKRDQWDGKNCEWKEVVKLARVFCHVPREPDMFHGFLHDCEKTYMTDKCHEPTVDRDRWTQYCFAQVSLLGKKRLFIEFLIDWNDWTNEGSDALVGSDERVFSETRKRTENDIKTVLKKRTT